MAELHPAPPAAPARPSTDPDLPAVIDNLNALRARYHWFIDEVIDISAQEVSADRRPGTMPLLDGLTHLVMGPGASQFAYYAVHGPDPEGALVRLGRIYTPEHARQMVQWVQEHEAAEAAESAPPAPLVPHLAELASPALPLRLQAAEAFRELLGIAHAATLMHLARLRAHGFAEAELMAEVEACGCPECQLHRQLDVVEALGHALHTQRQQRDWVDAVAEVLALAGTAIREEDPHE